METRKIDMAPLITTASFSNATIKACAIGESLYKEYTGKGGYQQIEAQLENAGRKLRKNFHGIALLAVELATVKGMTLNLGLAQAYFVELCKRVEAKLLKDHPQANGVPYDKIGELITVWGNYKTQTKQFFEGVGKMPESKDASDNPADYKPEEFVNEMVSRKASQSRTANPTDGLPGMSDSVKAAYTVFAESVSKTSHDWQDANILPLLAQANALIAAHVARQGAIKATAEALAPLAAGSKATAEKVAGKSEADAPERQAA